MQPIKPIHNEADYELALQDIDRCLDAAAGSPERDRLEVLTVLVDDYEAKHYPISPGRLPDDVLIRSTGEGRSFILTRAKRVKARVAM
jgi:antitoxin component HigA of HigAB toxin-antitoxin module